VEEAFEEGQGSHRAVEPMATTTKTTTTTMTMTMMTMTMTMTMMVVVIIGLRIMNFFYFGTDESIRNLT
jgi:hypothetical protein